MLSRGLDKMLRFLILEGIQPQESLRVLTSRQPAPGALETQRQRRGSPELDAISQVNLVSCRCPVWSEVPAFAHTPSRGSIRRRFTVCSSRMMPEGCRVKLLWGTRVELSRSGRNKYRWVLMREGRHQEMGCACSCPKEDRHAA